MRVTFRAQFQGRIKKLAPVGYTFPHPPVEQIEIYRRVDKWLARVGKVDIPQLGSEPSHGAMKDAVAENFEKHISDWVLCDPNGVPIDPARIEEDPKGNFTLLSDTHIATESQAGITGKNEYRTECGAIVKVTDLKTKRGDVPPTCERCKVAWDKLKETKSA